jgi:phosphoribosylformylglycinamidine synthase
MDLDMHFLHDGLPQMILETTYADPDHPEPEFQESGDRAGTLLSMLGRLNLCSKEYVVRQYDHEVQAGSVVKPLVGKHQDVASDAAVIRPLLDSVEGIGLSHSLYPTYGDIDTYWMAACAIDTAIRNLAVVGVLPDRIALLDNFCWCSSDEPERLGQLKRAAQACYDFATAFGTPFVSGKDSMYNDFKGFDAKDRPVKISVPPTLLVSSFGIIPDVTESVTLDAKSPGDRLYLLGTTRDELAGSEYYALMGELLQGKRFVGRCVPEVDADRNRELYQALHQAIRRKRISAAASLGLGGLAIAASKMALAGDLGMEVDLSRVMSQPDGLRADRILYSESQGRILVTVSPENEEAFLEIMGSLPCRLVGRVTAKPLFRIRDVDDGPYLEEGLASMREAYKKTLGW